MTIQVKSTEQYFPVVRFIMLYKVFLTFKPVVEILTCDHSSERYEDILSCGAVFLVCTCFYRRLVGVPLTKGFSLAPFVVVHQHGRHAIVT